MNDSLSFAEKARAAACCRIRPGTLLCRLGVAVALAAAASLAATAPAPAQSQQTPAAEPPPPKASPPKRRGIMSSPDGSAPSAAPSPAGKYKSNDDSVPGGLPGAQQPKTPTPGGQGG
jgi:hypothetical protein